MPASIMRRRRPGLQGEGEPGGPRSRRAPAKRAGRDPAAFARVQARLLDEMGESYRRDKESAGSLPDPNLVFKVELNARVRDETFRRSLAGVGIETVSSAPARSGYWIGLTDDPGFARLRRKLERHAAAKTASFMDRVRAIREISPGEKIGAGLSRRPLPESGQEYVDVEVWRLDDERLSRFMGAMRAVVRDGGGRITDQMKTDGYCALRVQCGRPLLEKITRMREVARIDRPPRTGIRTRTAAAAAPEPGMP